MKTIVNPNRDRWDDLCLRPGINLDELEREVASLLDRVKKGGLESVRQLTRHFDGYLPIPLEVEEEKIAAAESSLPAGLKDSILMAAENIRKFHSSQIREPEIIDTSEGVKCWLRDVPIESAGLYIPGGTAPLFSTVLMLAIPARIAGCREVSICTPANREGDVDPAVLYTAKVCGVKNIYRIGGVQAIGAMAYGVSPVPKADKIFGPGNQYVTMAKQLVSRQGVAIDMPAGPSEVLVMADESADPVFVAADLVSQAEHGADSQVVLLCTSEKLLATVNTGIDEILETLPRADIASKALANSLGIVMKNTSDMLEFSNLYAPEHLIISLQKSGEIADKVTNAGSVFIGNYSPESAGDYASGTNHTLPTNAFARSYSGLNLQSFMKTIQFQELTPDGISGIGNDIMNMARAEGLEGHSLAVELRLKRLKDGKI